MGKGISIGVGADTRQFSQGVARGVVEPLEDVSKALDGVTKDGDKAGDKLEASMRDAQRATDRTGDEFKTLGNVIDREAKSAGRSIDRELTDGTDRAGHAVTSFKDEAAQNFAEVASSFDGSIEGAVDGVQGTLGGLATAIGGPVGLAFGGIGLAAGAAFTLIQQGAADSEERVSQMYDDMIESGNRFVSENYISEAIQAIQTNAEGAVATYSAAQESAQLTGASLSTTLRALAGDTEAQTRVEEDRVRALQASRDEQEKYIEVNGRESAKIGDKIGALELLEKQFNRTNSEQQSAVDRSQVYLEAMGKSKSAADNTADAIGRIADQQARVNPNQNIVLTVDTSQAERQLSLFLNRDYNVGVGVLLRPGQEVE
jgi:hypothetical protein